MLNIYYGNETIKKDEFILSSIDPHERTILIVPDQFSLAMEKKALSFFRDRVGTRALMDLMVTDFSALGHKVIKEGGGKKPELIDKYGRHMLLSIIIQKLSDEGELGVYGKLGGGNAFSADVNSLISEMKRYGVSPDNIRDAAEKSQNYLREKLLDIGKIFGAYEETIEGRYTDSEDYIRFYGQLMKDSQLIAGSEVWIYGFDIFSPLHMEIIENILHAAKNVNVVMTWESGCNVEEDDGRAVLSGKGEDLFELTGYVISRLAELGEALGKGGQIEKIEAFHRRSVWSDESRESISIGQMTNVYSEADRVAAYITGLVRDKGYRFSEIAVICNDMDVRGGILQRTFDRWQIPSFADRKRTVLHQPVVRFLLSFLEVIAGGYDGGALMEMVSSGLMNWPATDEELLSNYVKEARIRGNKWKKPFVWQGRDEFGSRYSQEDLNRLNEMRSFIIEMTEGARDEIGRRNKVAEKVDGLCDFLENSFDIEGRIKDLTERQISLGLVEGAGETAQSWSFICDMLDQIKTIIGEESISNSRLEEIMTAGLKAMEIGLVPSSHDCVIIGTMQRTRLTRIRALIVTGANEGILPMEMGDSGLLTDRELEKLEELKFNISKRDQVRRREEELAIYRMFSLPEDELLVTCSLADQDGKNLSPSSIFSLLLEMKEGKTFGDLGKEDLIEMVSSRRGTSSYMASAMQGFLENGKIDEGWLEVINWFKDRDPGSIEGIRQGLSFDNRMETLGRELAEGLYFGDSETISVSASRLEQYSGCPFKHFIERGLKAEEPRGCQIDGRSRGDVYHETLQIISRELTPHGDISVTDPRSPWMTVTEDLCRKRVEEILTQEAADYREGVYNSDGETRLQLQRIIDNCGDMAWAMIQQVRKSSIKRMYFEEPFGFGGNLLKPIVIELENGKRAVLRGKIDRIDVMDTVRIHDDGNEEHYDSLRIVDYKTGSESVNREYIEKGYKLQLMVYMNAAEGESSGEPAGVFYFKINKVNSNADKEGTPAEKNETVWDRIEKSCVLEGIFVNSRDKLYAMDNTIDEKGKSRVLPTTMRQGQLSAKGGSELITEEEFREFEEKTIEHVERICREIQEGRIDILPKRESKKDLEGRYITACTYCKYKSICLFDTSFRGCRYEYL